MSLEMLLFANKHTKLKVLTFLLEKSQKAKKRKSERKSEFMCGRVKSEWKK